MKLKEKKENKEKVRETQGQNEKKTYIQRERNRGNEIKRNPIYTF